MEQSAYRVPKDHKRHLLAHLINEGNWHQVLIFCRTKHGANRLTQQLERAGINAMAIHGNKSQNARVKALQDFKENRITALVATEVAARGLDIKELPHVVNYELPNVPEDYVHRIGRTARAGSTGAAMSLVSPDELSYLRDIEKLLKRKIDFVEPPKFEIKEGTHAPRNATGEHQPHQDPRRRPEHRRSGGGGRPNHAGGRTSRWRASWRWKPRCGPCRSRGVHAGQRCPACRQIRAMSAFRCAAQRRRSPVLARTAAAITVAASGVAVTVVSALAAGGGGGRRGGQGGAGRSSGGGGNRGGFARGARSSGGRSGGGSSGGSEWRRQRRRLLADYLIQAAIRRRLIRCSASPSGRRTLNVVPLPISVTKSSLPP